MNRIYKSIYNAARRCVVCVSEATSSAQGRKGTRLVSESMSVKFLSKITLAVLSSLFSAQIFALNITVNDGEKLVMDVSNPYGYGLIIATSNESGIITNYGDLEISGTPLQIALVLMLAYGENAQAKIENKGDASLLIQAGENAPAIEYNAYNGGTGHIVNENGTLTIKGSDYSSTAGFGLRGNAYNAEDGASHGVIENIGSGTILIEGGAGEGASAISENANAEYSNLGLVVGEIKNSGSGTLKIVGGSNVESYGVAYNAVYSGIGKILNESNGTLTIQGGTGSNGYGVEHNAYGSGSNGTISNTGSGTLTIQLYLEMAKANYEVAFVIALILIVVVLVLNFLAKWISKRFDVNKID